MQRPWKTLLWGVGLLVVGVFFTLFALGMLDAYREATVLGLSAALAIAGLLFLAATLARRGAWWLVLPGVLLLGIAAVVYLGGTGQGDSRLQAAALFAALGLGHLLLFISNRQQRWWAWLIGGTFLVLAALFGAGVSSASPLFGAALLLGFSAVLLLYYLVMPATEPRWWTLLMGVVAAMAAGFVLTVSAPRAGFIVQFWPVVFALLGLVLIIWAIARWSAAAPVQEPAYTPPSPPSPEAAPTGVTPVPEEVPAKPAVPEPTGTVTPAPETEAPQPEKPAPPPVEPPPSGTPEEEGSSEREEPA